MSLINRIMRDLYLMETTESLDEFQQGLKQLFKSPENSLLDVIRSQYDYITKIIVKEKIAFNSFLFLSALMNFKDKNTEIWLEALIILRKTLIKISELNFEKTIEIFLEYHSQLLSEIHSKDKSMRFERICEIYLFLFTKEILNEEYVLKNEINLLQGISQWEKVDGLPRKGVELLQWIFPKNIYSYSNFSSEIKKNFSQVAHNRITLLKEYEQFKEIISGSEYDYQCVKIYCLIRKGNNWRVPIIQAKFGDEEPTSWESLLTCTPERFKLYSRVFPKHEFYRWMDKIVMHYEVEIDNLVIKINFNNVRFNKYKEINANNDVYVNPEFAAKLFSVRLDSNLGYDIGSDLRLRIGRNPYETIEEIIKEELNYNIKSTDVNWGHLIIFLPKLHARIQKITYTHNKWNIYLIPSEIHPSSDYNLYYILKDKKGRALKRGMSEGSSAQNNILTILVPLNIWEIWCRLDYGNSTVDWYDKVKDEIEMDLLKEVLQEINENIPENSRLPFTELNGMISYMGRFIVFSNINKAVEVYISPFKPINIPERLSSLTELSERFETFLKKLHEDSKDQNIQSSYSTLRMKTLTGILGRKYNIFSSEKWFHEYNSNKNLVRGGNSTEFNHNWNTLYRNEKGFDLELICVMMTTLCRNISAHLNWNNKIWIMYEPFQKTVEMILTSYLIAWKYRE